MGKREVTSKRVESIYNFCDGLHDDINVLYEIMVDGTDAAEKKHIEFIQKKLSELNLDRE
jgi:hypothetical protein